MKLEPFNLSQAKWDDWRAFHRYPARNFVQFDTNELIVTTTKFDPDFRKFYSTLNVSIFSTADEKCPPLFEEPHIVHLDPARRAKPIPKAWLTEGGGQTILVDHCTKQVVALGTIKDHIPVRLRGRARAYFAGPGEPPVGARIILRPPMVWSEADEQHFADTIAACQMWAGLNEYPKPTSQWDRGSGSRNAITIPWQPLDRQIVHEVSFEMLTDVHKVQIAWHGLSNHRARKEVDRLYTT